VVCSNGPRPLRYLKSPSGDDAPALARLDRVDADGLVGLQVPAGVERMRYAGGQEGRPGHERGMDCAARWVNGSRNMSSGSRILYRELSASISACIRALYSSDQ
jgi:hypothetical protein